MELVDHYNSKPCVERCITAERSIRRIQSQGTATGRIAIVEANGFQLKMYEGDVILTEPQFANENTDAETYLHRTQKEATFDADIEVQESVAAGWIPYSPFE